jgi:hypothetical protein
MTVVSNLPDISGTLRTHTRCSYRTASSYNLQEQGYSCVNVQLLLGQHVEQPDEQAIQQAVHCSVQIIIQCTTSIHTHFCYTTTFQAVNSPDKKKKMNLSACAS